MFESEPKIIEKHSLDTVVIVSIDVDSGVASVINEELLQEYDPIGLKSYAPVYFGVCQFSYLRKRGFGEACCAECIAESVTEIEAATFVLKQTVCISCFNPF